MKEGSLLYRALEKVDKEQLNRKRFEIYQTISCFGAFLLTLSLNNITKLVSKSIKISTLFQIIIESNCIKFLSTLLKNIHTSPSSPYLTYFWVQLFSVPYSISLHIPKLHWATKKHTYLTLCNERIFDGLQLSLYKIFWSKILITFVYLFTKIEKLFWFHSLLLSLLRWSGVHSGWIDLYKF